MANGFNVQRYRSLSRPSGGGGSNSAFSSLAKKQASAEDAIVDNQYEAGLISAEFYQSELIKRKARTWNTPLQVVNLDEKIVKVRESVQDAEVDRMYQAGDLTTDQVLQYERGRLSRITQSDSVAYQKQAQKVQALTDKAEREKRTQYRISEQLRISQMPEDSSESLQQKAQLYADLEFQARQDGDNQQADQLAIQKNNLVGQARRAGLSDRVRDVRRTISEYLPPEYTSQFDFSSSGAKQTGAGVGSGATVPTVGSNNVATGGAVSTSKFGGSSTGVTKAYKAYDNAYKSLLSSYQDNEKLSYQIGEYKKIYEEARAAGDLDTADSLEIQINNLENGMRSNIDSIANKEARLGELEERIYAAQASAAVSNFKKWKSTNDKELKLEELKLENDLRTGKLTKEKYIQESIKFTKGKVDYLTEVADGYRQIGDDDAASKLENDDIFNLQVSPIGRVLEGISQIEDPHQIEQSLRSFGDSFELIRVDKNGTLDNLTGKTRSKGDISVVDVSDLKESGAFNQNYVQDGNVYAKIKFPGELGFDGQPVPVSNIKQKFQLGITKGETPFYYDAKGNKKKVGLIEVKSPNGTQSLIRTEDWLKKNQKFVVPRQETGKGGAIASSNVFYDVKQLPKADGPNPILTNIAKASATLRKVPGLQELGDFIFKNPFKGDQGTQNTIRAAQKGLTGLDNFDLVGDAYAEGTKKDPTFDEAVRIVSKQYGFPENVLRATAAAETGAGRGTNAKTVKPHNYFNIQAYDSNVNAAKEYKNALEGVEAFAKLIKTDKRYQKAWAVRNDPERFLQEVEKAGYAGDPRTYPTRATNGFNSWSEFVKATPEYKAQQEKDKGKVTPTPTPTPVVKKPVLQVSKPKPFDVSKIVQGTQPGVITQKVTQPQAPKVIAPTVPVIKRPDTNNNGRVDFGESVVGSAIKNTAQAVKNAFTPQPVYKSPVPSVKPPVQSPVQKAVQNVGNTVQQAAQNVGRGAGIVVDTAKKAVQKATGFLKKLF